MRLTRAERRILKTLDRHEEPPKIDVLCKWTGLAEKRFTKVLKGLEAFGYVEVTPELDVRLTVAGKARARESWLRSIADKLILAVVIAVITALVIFLLGSFGRELLTWWRSLRTE